MPSPLRSKFLLMIAATFMLALPAAAATVTSSSTSQATAPTTATTTTKHVAIKHASRATGMRAGRGETVEQRISNLHAELRITPQEESRWQDVAQVMRENAADMQQMVADKHAQNPQARNAKDDLKVYQEFAQAHVDGLKRLRSAFNRLYDFMPDAQKQVADQVFQKAKS